MVRDDIDNESQVILETCSEVAKSVWVMDSTVSMHICHDQFIFKILDTNRNFKDLKFEHFKM